MSSVNNRRAALIAAASAVSHTPKGGLAITWDQHVNRIAENATAVNRTVTGPSVGSASI